MLSRWIAVLIVPVAGIMALGFVDAAGRDYDTCFYVELNFIFWGLGCCLVGTFLSAMLFAVCRAPRISYVVLVAAMLLTAAAGYGLGAAECLRWHPESLLVFAGLFLVASLMGLLFGYLLGYLFGYLGDRLL